MGQAGEIDSETACIAFEYDLPPDDFKIEVLNCLPPTPWIIPDEERAVRRPLQVMWWTLRRIRPSAQAHASPYVLGSHWHQ